MNLLGGVFQSLLVGACLLSPMLCFLSLAASLRLLPPFLRFLHGCLRVLLILSFRLYRLLLQWVSDTVKVDLLQGWRRLAATTLVSTVVGLTLILVAGWNVEWWSFGICVLHGLCIGLVWREIETPGGVQLGVKLE